MAIRHLQGWGREDDRDHRGWAILMGNRFGGLAHMGRQAILMGNRFENLQLGQQAIRMGNRCLHWRQREILMGNLVWDWLVQQVAVGAILR
jgi:hypothetical protein